jgi:hypothetical protein
MVTNDEDVPTPAILGPETFSRVSVNPPVLHVDLGGVRHYAVELASDPSLFASANAAKRNAANFFASWTSGLIGPVVSSTYAIPSEAWEQLRSNDALYYRVLSSSSGDSWQSAKASTSDGGVFSAGKIQVTKDTDPATPRVVRRVNR